MEEFGRFNGNPTTFWRAALFVDWLTQFRDLQINFKVMLCERNGR
jgi:hypothetical protein